MGTVGVIITAPPYADFLEEIVQHPLVKGLRLNTVMPLKEGPGEALKRLGGLGLPLWVDLKGRQLRVAEAAIPPFTEVKLSHAIQVDTPVDCFFSDGREHGRVAAVDGNRLILSEGPQRLIGPGESVNIVHPSLRVDGYLTEKDIEYLLAMKAVGMKKVMLSYMEGDEDIAALREILPDAELILKIETMKGLAFAEENGSGKGRLMAARGDLFVEVLHPHKILGAMKTIIQADPNAIAASRLFDSLGYHPVPGNADISDAAYLLSLGYQTFMLGDIVSLRRDPLLEALNLLEAIVEETGIQ